MKTAKTFGILVEGRGGGVGKVTRNLRDQIPADVRVNCTDLGGLMLRMGARQVRFVKSG
jgi:hypothetical protein